MKRPSHWTTRYLFDRTLLEIAQRRHPDDPWLTAEAVRLLERLMRAEDTCFEWGAGRSTAWFASRATRVVSAEHDPAWYDRVSSTLGSQRNVELRLVASEESEYAGALHTCGGTFDIILVDGLFRDACALSAVDRVNAGGLIVVDNVERHLPSTSRSPESIGARYETEAWRTFGERTAAWRRVWTSNGVTDTALFFAP